MINPDSVHLYAYLNGSRVDITEYFIGCTSRWGMRSNRPTDRVADVGSMDATLKNPNGEFTPGHTNCLSGWKKGVYISLVISYDGVDHMRFRGTLERVRFDAGTKGPRKAYITVLDWMKFSLSQPVSSITVETDMASDDAIMAVAGMMTDFPYAYSLDAGVHTLDSVFDLGNTDTKAMTEFARITNSEFGYLYEQKEQEFGSLLRFENAIARNGLVPLTSFATPSAAADSFLLLESSGELLLESGGYLPIENSLSTLQSDNDMISVSVVNGEHQINNLKVVAYPRITSASASVLYEMAAPQWLSTKYPMTLRVNYYDSDSGQYVTIDPANIITPVATTDYTVNRYPDGLSTDMTASITVSVTAYTTYADITITNGLDYAGYITKFQLRGYKTETGQTVEATATNDDSVSEYGYQNADIYQQYQTTTMSGEAAAKSIVAIEAQPRNVLNRITFSANKSATNMQAFLNLDVGDKFYCKEDQSAIDGNHYINGVEFSINGKYIDFSYIPRESFSILDGNMSYVGVQFGSTGTTDRLDFGFIKHLQYQRAKTISFWIYLTHTYSTDKAILYFDGVTVYLDNSYKIRYKQAYALDNNYGIWYESDALSLNTWYHVAITHDTTSSATAAPIMYLNGTSKSITAVSTVSPATIPTDITASLLVGASQANDLGLRAKLKDLRIYNTVLTSGNITTLYNDGAGNASITSGLRFNPFAVLDKDLTYYTNHTMVDGDAVFDDYILATGTPSGNPITFIP